MNSLIGSETSMYAASGSALSVVPNGYRPFSITYTTVRFTEGGFTGHYPYKHGGMDEMHPVNVITTYPAITLYRGSYDFPQGTPSSWYTLVNERIDGQSSYTVSFASARNLGITASGSVLPTGSHNIVDTSAYIEFKHPDRITNVTWNITDPWDRTGEAVRINPSAHTYHIIGPAVYYDYTAKWQFNNNDPLFFGRYSEPFIAGLNVGRGDRYVSATMNWTATGYAPVV